MAERKNYGDESQDARRHEEDRTKHPDDTPEPHHKSKEDKFSRPQPNKKDRR